MRLCARLDNDKLNIVKFDNTLDIVFNVQIDKIVKANHKVKKSLLKMTDAIIFNNILPKEDSMLSRQYIYFLDKLDSMESNIALKNWIHSSTPLL